MSTAGPQQMVNFCILRAAQLQDSLTSIMIDKEDALRQTAQLAKEYSNQKDAAKALYKSGDMDVTEYQDTKDDLENDYNAQLATINEWETELDSQQDTQQSELNDVNAQKQSYQTLKLNNAKSEFTYGGSK